MWSKIDAYIKKYKLLNANNLYLVALSGGADSVALLLLLKEHGFNVHAAHCNFHLRGAESDRDEAFCVELCRGLGIELHRAHFDTKAYADLHMLFVIVTGSFFPSFTNVSAILMIRPTPNCA